MLILWALHLLEDHRASQVFVLPPPLEGDQFETHAMPIVKEFIERASTQQPWMRAQCEPRPTKKDVAGVLLDYRERAHRVMCGHNDDTSSSSSRPSWSSYRFVVIATDTGLGNRMQVGVSALALALATGRIVLDMWPLGQAAGCSSPLQLFASPGYPYFVRGEVLLPLLEDPRITHRIVANGQLGLSLDWLRCQHLRKALQPWSILLIDFAHGHTFFAPMILFNPHHRAYFDKAFPNHTFARDALLFLYQPSPSVAARVLPCPGGVGVHLRVAYHERESEALSVRAFATALRNKGATQSAFVTTDRAGALSLLRKEMGPTFELLSRPVPVKVQQEQGCEEIGDAFADMMTLASCSQTILGNRASSFSAVAASRARGLGTTFVSVCTQHCSGGGGVVVERPAHEAICYGELRHVRWLSCVHGGDDTPQCCADGWCDERCFYHAPGVAANLLFSLTYMRPWVALGKLLLVCGGVFLVIRRLRRPSWVAEMATSVILVVFAIVLVFALNAIQHGHVLGPDRNDARVGTPGGLLWWASVLRLRIINPTAFEPPPIQRFI